jgi:hypothetical protein
MDNGPAVLENHFLLVITISAWQALLKHASVLKCNPADDPVQSLYIDRAGPARPVRPGRRICSVNPENPRMLAQVFREDHDPGARYYVEDRKIASTLAREVCGTGAKCGNS